MPPWAWASDEPTLPAWVWLQRTQCVLLAEIEARHIRDDYEVQQGDR